MRFPKIFLASMLVATAATIAFAASNKRKKEMKCNMVDTVVCDGHTPPSAEVVGEATCEAFTFSLSNITDAVEIIHTHRHWIGEGECKEDEDFCYTTNSVSPAVRWGIVLDNGYAQSGSGDTAMVARGDSLAAYCIFNVESVMPKCEEVVTNVFSAYSSFGCDISIEGTPHWIGIDRTGNPDEPYESTHYIASAAITPDLECVENVEWEYSGVCEQHNIGDWNASLWTTNREAASESYESEIVTASALGSIATNRFTAVKVDVTIDGLDEKEEDETGAFIAYVRDATNDVISVEGTNRLVSVSFSCEPGDLPDGETVTISCSGPAELYEESEDGALTKVMTAIYPVDNLTGRRFKLHGHSASTAFTNGLVTISHEPSGARDNAKYTVLNPPSLVPDYNRNRMIDEHDENVYEQGTAKFRFWTNDDNDSGDTNNSENDRPCSGADGQDLIVNGRCDLLDFTPVMLDISGIFPPGTPNYMLTNICWKLHSSVLNAVWTALTPETAGIFHKADCGAIFGSGLVQNVHTAAVVALSEEYGGKVLDDAFYSFMTNNANRGIVMVEGRSEGSGLILKCCRKSDSREIIYGKLDVVVSSVEDMYRWMNLRMVCGDDSGRTTCLDEPSNRPDSECDEKHFVFVHGYNVDLQSARGWASEVFKRLWQSGSQSMFTAVDWYGNDSQIWDVVPVIGGESLDYYINVRHALDTALNFSVTANALPGSKIILAHSLGNMLVSEAAKYHLLDYSKYYMLNAAVPMEAYDDDAGAQEMIEHGWRDVDPSKWAANWYEHIIYSGDPRQSLKWRGRFAGIHDVINCYSPTEDILANATTNGWGGLWGAQELFKGTAALHFIPGNCEGGWGYDSKHTNLVGLLNDFAKTNEFTDAELIDSPIFRKFDNDLLHQTNLISIAQTELNKVMGDGIPARSFAAGRNPMEYGVIENYNFWGADRPNGWPRDNNRWLHSDITKVAYFYVFDFFDNLTK